MDSTGPISYLTSNLLLATEFALSPKEDDHKVVSALKTGTIYLVTGFDRLVRLIERLVSFLFTKGKEIYNSETFQNGKKVALEYASRAKDYVFAQATRFYQHVSTFQRPS